jgi:hypothetical protein
MSQTVYHGSDMLVSKPDINKCKGYKGVISGPVADDQTARVIDLFIDGAYGKIDTLEAVQIAIRQFEIKSKEMQIAFRTEGSLKLLNYISHEVIK